MNRGFCGTGLNGDVECEHTGHGYSIGFFNGDTFIGSSWTRGLAVHPVG